MSRIGLNREFSLAATSHPGAARLHVHVSAQEQDDRRAVTGRVHGPFRADPSIFQQPHRSKRQTIHHALRRRIRRQQHAANARRLAEGIAGLDGIRSPGDIAQPGDGPLDPGRVVTDFVLFKVDRDRLAFLAALEARGVLMVAYPHGQVRAVTHYGISAADIEHTIHAVAGALADTAPQPAGDRAPSAA